MSDDFSGNEGSRSEPVPGQRSTGRVKWFNNTKGFGFIVADGSDDGSDLFAHYSAIDMNGYRTLKAGQLVSFTTADGPKGLHAMDIRSAESASAGSDSYMDDEEHHGIDVELPASGSDTSVGHASAADSPQTDDDGQLPGSNAAHR